MDFQKKRLKNGITVLFEKRELPLVSVSITNRFGGAYEELKIKGIAHLIEHMVFTGTKTRTHEDISREIEKRGGILNAFTAHEVTSFYFKLPSEHIFFGLDILCDILNNPTFDKEKFEKEKKVVIEEIKMYRDDPQKHVFELIEKAMFEDPFGEGIIGNETSVGNLERDFVVDFFKKAYNPADYIVSITGNADFNKICSYLEKKFVSKRKEVQELMIKKKNSEIIEERAGVDQANFIFGVHAPIPATREHYALEVLDAYLANGMSSRLFLEIREKRGLAYAVKSEIVGEKNYCYYLIYAGTVKKAVEEVKEITLKEFRDIEKMSEKDLNESKERLIGLERVSKENSSAVMQSLTYAEIFGGAEEYYKYDEKIKSIKLEEVKKLAREIVKKYSIAMVLPK